MFMLFEGPKYKVYRQTIKIDSSSCARNSTQQTFITAWSPWVAGLNEIWAPEGFTLGIWNKEEYKILRSC